MRPETPAETPAMSDLPAGPSPSLAPSGPACPNCDADTRLVCADDDTPRGEGPDRLRFRCRICGTEAVVPLR